MMDTAEKLTELLDRAGKEKSYLLELRQSFGLRVRVATFPLIGQGFHIIGTDWTMEAPPTGQYLGTVQIGGFVWHIFKD